MSSAEFPGKFKYIKPHNAIVFSRLNNGFRDTNPYLTLRTSVFLPVGKDKNIVCKTEQSYCLTLHGYFFVDFARTGILGWDDNNSRINAEKIEGDDSISLLKKNWNFHLYSILLSRFLNVFKIFVNQYSLSNDEISAICKSMYQSQLFQYDSNRERICENKQWVFCLNSQANQKNSWTLLDKEVRVLSLPEVPDWNYLPGLKQIAKLPKYRLTLSNKPNLRFDGITSEPWTDEEIISIFSNLSDANILKNYNAVNYLVLFLKDSCKGKIGDKVQNHLTSFVKEGFSQLKWTELNSHNKDTLQQLVKLIDISQVIYIDVNESIFKHIVQIDTSVLVLPKSLFNSSNNNPSARLNEQDATAIFSKINQWINQLQQKGKNINLLEPILKQFLYLSRNNIIQILSNNPDWRCLLGNSYPNGKTQFYSYRQFQNLRNGYLLFRKPSDSLIDILIKAIKNFQPIIVEENIANLLKSDSRVSPVNCDIQCCKQLLAQTPVLSEPKNRVQLLKELLKK